MRTAAFLAFHDQLELVTQIFKGGILECKRLVTILHEHLFEV